MDYQVYSYIALAILSPILVGVLVKTIKFVLTKALPETVKDYFVAMRSVIWARV